MTESFPQFMHKYTIVLNIYSAVTQKYIVRHLHYSAQLSWQAVRAFAGDVARHVCRNPGALWGLLRVRGTGV